MNHSDPRGKRLLDVGLSALALLLLWPLILLAMLGIALSSPGPLIYRAQRIGRHGHPFTMYKLRTMGLAPGGSQITRAHDPRVFAWGRFLRAFKIDELPQLVNILRGEMSIVGPRPEAPDLVARYYKPEHQETLSVRPGLTSPGVLFAMTHGEALVGEADPEGDYGEKLLPLKLAIERIYVRRARVSYDLQLILRTLIVLLALRLGQTRFPEPPELAPARRLLET